MIKKIEELLKKNKEISDYLINDLVRESNELYFVHEKLETVRSTNQENINVTIYVDHKEFRGDSKFEVAVSDSDLLIEEKINDAVEKAKLINNPYYPLQKNDVKSFKSNSNIKDYTPMSLGKAIAKDMISLNTKAMHFNAIEIFIYKTNKEIKNSQGIDKKETSYSAFVEAIPTFDGVESVELYESYKFNEYDETYLKERMASKLNDAMERSKAQKPEAKLSSLVMLKNQEILELAEALAREVNYQTTYVKQNSYNVGDSIQNEATPSKLSIYKTNILGGKAVDNFDDDGTTLNEALIIDNGKYVGQYGSNRFAYYYKKNPTGNLRRTRVEANNTYSEINEDYLECVSFSGLQVDIENNYIGGEVRLAYLHSKGAKLPITGISISGKLDEVLAKASASNKKVVTDYYEGPAALLFAGFNIL